MGTGTGGSRTRPPGEAHAQPMTSDPCPGTLRTAFPPHAGVAGKEPCPVELPAESPHRAPGPVGPRPERDCRASGSIAPHPEAASLASGPAVPRGPTPPRRIDPILHANPARASPPPS